MLRWILRNWVVLAFVIALVASFGVQTHESGVAVHETKIDNIASCVRENARSALGIAWQQQVIKVSRGAGPGLTRPFERLSRGSEAYLAIARFIQNPTEATHTHVVILDNGTSASVLTDKSTNLIERGCEQHFHGQRGDAVDPQLPVKRVLDPNRIKEHPNQ